MRTVNCLLNRREMESEGRSLGHSKGNKLQAFDSRAAKWCALGAIQKTYPPVEWGEAMDQVLRALSYSDAGLAQMTKTDKACCLMEWNDDYRSSFEEIRGILLEVDI
jgi:hypothetical protein